MYMHTHKVQYYETDKMQITHHSNYIRFMEEARIGFLAACGYKYEDFEKDGIVSPVVSVSCNFKKSTTFPDIINIKVYVKSVTPVRFVLGYIMYVDDNIVCTASSGHCFMKKEGHIISIKKEYPEFFEVLTGEIEE